MLPWPFISDLSVLYDQSTIISDNKISPKNICLYSFAVDDSLYLYYFFLYYSTDVMIEQMVPYSIAILVRANLIFTLISFNKIYNIFQQNLSYANKTICLL